MVDPHDQDLLHAAGMGRRRAERLKAYDSMLHPSFFCPTERLKHTQKSSTQPDGDE